MKDSAIKHYLKLIKLIVISCCSPDVSKRPALEWIYILMRKITSDIEQIY
jgi:hypothetical protein